METGTAFTRLTLDVEDRFHRLCAELGVSTFVEAEPHRLETGELVRVGPDVRRQLVNRSPQRLAVLAIGGAKDHEGRDGVAFASWEDSAGVSPGDLPLPEDVPIEG